jgi:hypothetical protein
MNSSIRPAIKSRITRDDWGKGGTNFVERRVSRK